MNTRSTFNKDILAVAIRDSFHKLDPRIQWRNPVMFIVYIGAFLTVWFWVRMILAGGWTQQAAFTLQISLWLWFTVLFANFAEAIAEGRGKAQANALAQRTKPDTGEKVFRRRHQAG